MREAKRELRKAIRAAYPGDEERARQSGLICAQIAASERFRDAGTVCAYVPLRREADVMPLLRLVLMAGKRLLLPRVQGDGIMTLRCIHDLCELRPGAYGIPEPAADAEIVDPAEAELIIVPLEGIDRRGMRLGKGGGFYDRLLPQTKAFTLGAVLSWQWTDQVPAEPWDRPLNAAADQNGITHF